MVKSKPSVVEEVGRKMFKCECGHEVDRHDFLQVGLIFQPWRPVYVVFRFRCPRCGRVGERVVEYARLAAVMLGGVGAEVPEGEEERFRRMGPITVDEVIEFHRQLKEMKTLPPDLLAEPPKEED